MQSKAATVKEYIEELPDDRRESIEKLRKMVKANLPKGKSGAFQEEMNYGMIGYVVPHSIYPPGYHCDAKLPLPFLSLSSQKNHIGFYHMGIYANPELMHWFVTEWPKHSDRKLDMGKSCIRFKKPEHIPYKLLAELCQKMTPEDWVELYTKMRG